MISNLIEKKKKSMIKNPSELCFSSIMSDIECENKGKKMMPIYSKSNFVRAITNFTPSKIETYYNFPFKKQFFLKFKIMNRFS